MTDPAFLPYSSSFPSGTPDASRPLNSRALTAIAWLTIVTCVGLIVVGNFVSKRRASANRSPSETGLGADIEFLIQSRLGVGMRHALGPAASASALASVDQMAQNSPVRRLRAAIVAQELTGGSTPAQPRIEQLLNEALSTKLRADADALRTVYARGSRAIDAGQRQRLIEDHGWFAELALAHDLPDTDPARRAALAPAVRAVWTILCFFGAAGFGAVGGLVLLAVALVLRIDGKLPAAYRPDRSGRDGPFVEAFALYLLGMIAVSLLMGRYFARSGDEVPLSHYWLMLASIPLPLIWPKLRGLTWPEVRRGFGWTRGRGVAREIGCGLLGYVAGVPLIAVAMVLTIILSKLTGETTSHPIVEQAAGPGAKGVLGVLQLYAFASLYAPLAEETMFRGALFHHVRTRLPWFVSALIVAIVFASLHPQGLLGIPMLATIAIVLAALREWRGSNIAPMTAHACVNAVSMTLITLLTK